jgi:hypothetical protein
VSNPHAKPPKRTQFKPGKSGNPGGRPKLGVDLKAVLHEYLAKVDPSNRRSKAEQLMAALVEAGIEGNVKATMAVLDRMCGRVSADKDDTIDIGDLVAEVEARAKQRKRDREAKPAAELPGESFPEPAPHPLRVPTVRLSAPPGG